MRKKVVEKYSSLEEERQEKIREKEKKKSKKELKKKPLPEPAKAKILSPPVVQKPLFQEAEKRGDYRFPPFHLLEAGKSHEQIDKNELYEKKQQIEDKLGEFRVE